MMQKQMLQAVNPEHVLRKIIEMSLQRHVHHDGSGVETQLPQPADVAAHASFDVRATGEEYRRHCAT